jgi:hypothetical protein
MADAPTITTALKEIKAAYPRFVTDPDTVKVWAVYLSDLPNDLLMTAVRKFISSSTHAFPPSIPEIRQMATQVKIDIQDIPTAFEAWEDVLNAGNGWKYQTGQNPDGTYWIEKTPYKFKHLLVEEVAKRFGFPDRFPSPDGEMADRAHFYKAYESALNKAARAETQLPTVTAYIETEKRTMLDAGEQVRQLTEGMRK